MKVLNVLTGGIRREGISSTQLEFVRHLNDADLQMDYLAVHNNDPEVLQDFRDAGCRVIDMPDRKRALKQYIPALIRLMHTEKYDVIHVHGSSSLMAVELVLAKLCGIRVRIAHSRNTMCFNEKANRLLRPIFLGSYTDAFACGEDAGQWLFRGRPFTVIHNGKDLERFGFNAETRNSFRQEYGLHGKKVVGFVGKLNDQKNLFFLLDSFAELHRQQENTALFFMGDGPDRQGLEKRTAELGLQDCVRFTGSVTNVAELLQAMDIMLLPSRYEGLPNVVLEWQAAGLRSFVSDKVTRECAVCDLVEYLPIDQGTGLWAERMAQTTVAEDRSALSAQACEALKKNGFEIHESVSNVVSYYRRAVEEHRK